MHRSTNPSRESSYRKITFIYVVLISLSSFVFFCLALLAIQDHTSTIRELQADNIKLWANGVAVEFERRLRRSMERAVSDPQLREESYTLLDQRSAADFQDRIGTLKEQHPAVEYVFVLEDDELLYPSSDGSAEESLNFSLRVGSSFSRSYAQGRWHYRQRQFEQALSDFQQSLALAPSAVLRAESLNRIAETLDQLNYSTAADEAYDRLGSSYGDYLNQEGQPYLVVAALGQANLEVRPKQELIEQLESVRSDLLKGRWPLNLESLKAIDQLVAGEIPDSPSLDQIETKFLRDLRWQAARSKLLALPAGSPNHISSHTILIDSTPFQVFYQALAEENQEPLTLGVAATSQWLNEHLLAKSLDEIASSRRGWVTVDLEDSGRSGVATDAIHVPIALTPHWYLVISTEALQEEQSDLRFRMAALTISSVMFLAVLGLGIWLTFRMARKIHTHEAQTEFLNSFSHEVKTPLALVQLYSETLLGGEGSKEERKSYYRIIHHATERLKRLVVNFQNLALIRQDQKRYELREIDLVDLLTRNLSSYIEHLEHRGFTVDVSFHRQKLIAEADPEAVLQAVMNLLDNARKYSGDAKYVAISLRKGSDHAILEVLDKGPGISVKDRERVFDRFYRGAHQSHSSGFGFGLFLVKHIMEAHKGRVEFETSEGEGTTFRLIFPLVTDPDKLRVPRELPELEKPLHGGRYAQDSHY